MSGADKKRIKVVEILEATIGGTRRHLYDLVTHLDRDRFEGLVADAVASLPPELADRLDNVDVVVDDWPSPSQLDEVGLRHSESLLGPYEGVPQTVRGKRYGMVAPDKITIFQKPIERICRSDKEIKRQIGETVRHEIAHYFGISDERLNEIEEQGRR